MLTRPDPIIPPVLRNTYTLITSQRLLLSACLFWLTIALPASGGLIVLAGDTSFTLHLEGNMLVPQDPGNRQLFENILMGGDEVLIDTRDINSSDSVRNVNDFYNSLTGVTASVTSGSITPSALTGVDLFITMIPVTPYTPSELISLRDFSESGGSLFFMGEWNGITLIPANAEINSILTFLGSDLRIVNDLIDPGVHTGYGRFDFSGSFNGRRNFLYLRRYV